MCNITESRNVRDWNMCSFGYINQCKKELYLLGVCSGKCFHILGHGLWDTCKDLEIMNAFYFLLEKCRILISVESRAEKCLQ